MLIPLKEWAENVGINPATARQKAGRGKLPAVKVGRDWLIEGSTPNTDSRIKNGNYKDWRKKKMTRYDYQELREKAINNPTFDNLKNLADWLSNYDMNSWNGEFWDIDDGQRLYPVYGDEDENGCFPIVNYEIA